MFWQYLKDTFHIIICKDEELTKKKRSLRIYLSSFFVPFILIILIYGSIGTWPFIGPNSVLILDMNSQYVYFFANLRRILLGENSFVYSWTRALGGEFMGMFAYYLASPLSWIVVLFPASSITDAIWLILVIKIGICGLTMSLFLNICYPTKTVNIVLFSTLYALCSYNIAYMNNIMWLDAVMLLPLLALGIEQLISDRKYLLYTCILALIVLSNYYIGYMVCIFVVFYFIYYHIAKGRTKGTFSEKEQCFFLKSILRTAVFSVIAIAISAIIIIPSYYSLSFGKLTYNNLEYSVKYRDLLGVIIKAFFGQVDTVRPSGYPFIYCGTLTLFSALSFFIAKIKLREKLGMFLFLTIFILSFVISDIDILWHGGHTPNWLNARYSFMFSFMLLICAYQGFAQILQIRFRYIALFGVALGVLVGIWWLLSSATQYDYFERLNLDYKNLLLLINFIIIGTFVFLIYYYRKTIFQKKRIGVVSLIFFVLCEAYISGVAQNIALSLDLKYSSRESYADFININQPIVDHIYQQDDSFYRMEKTYYRMVNDNMALNIRGISGSTSTLNAQTLGFLKRMGYRSTDFFSWHQGQTPANNSLLGIKYIIDDGQNPLLSEYYNLVYTDNVQQRYVYENPYALSLAFATHSTVLDTNDFDCNNPFEYINLLFSNMLGEPCEVFKQLSVFSIKSLKNVENLTSCFVEKNTNCNKSTYIVRGTGEVVYMYIPSSISKTAEVVKNNENIDLFLSGFCASKIEEIGFLEKDKIYNIVFQSGDDALFFGDDANFLYVLDYDVFASAITWLKSNQLNISSDFSENSFSGTVTITEEKSILLTSIPYDSGWKIYANGKQIKTMHSAFDSLIAIELPPGVYEIKFVYFPKELLIGAIISVLGIVAFIGIIIIKRFKAKKRHLARRLCKPVDGQGRVGLYGWAVVPCKRHAHGWVIKSVFS